MKKFLPVLAFLFFLHNCASTDDLKIDNKNIHNLFAGKIMYNGSNFDDPELNGTSLQNIILVVRNCEDNVPHLFETHKGVFIKANIPPGKYKIDRLMFRVHGTTIYWPPPTVDIPRGEFMILQNRINITGRMYWNCDASKMSSFFFTNIEYEEVRSSVSEYIRENHIQLDKWNYVTIAGY